MFIFFFLINAHDGPTQIQKIITLVKFNIENSKATRLSLVNKITHLILSLVHTNSCCMSKKLVVCNQIGLYGGIAASAI